MKWAAIAREIPGRTEHAVKGRFKVKTNCQRYCRYIPFFGQVFFVLASHPAVSRSLTSVLSDALSRRVRGSPSLSTSFFRVRVCLSSLVSVSSFSFSSSSWWGKTAVCITLAFWFAGIDVVQTLSREKDLDRQTGSGSQARRAAGKGSADRQPASSKVRACVVWVDVDGGSDPSRRAPTSPSRRSQFWNRFRRCCLSCVVAALSSVV